MVTAGDLWIQNIKTGNMKNVSKMDIPVHQGTWSTDGNHVFGTALNLKVRHPVYRFNMYGKKQEIIPAGSRAPETEAAIRTPSLKAQKRTCNFGF